MSRKNKTSRRKILKSVGITTTGLAGFTTNNRATEGNKYVGVAYDPSTHEIVGEASGQFSSATNQLHGNLRVGNEQITLSKNKPYETIKQGSTMRTRFKKEIPAETAAQNSRQDGNEPTKLVKVLTGADAGLTGYINPPSGDKQAFALVNQSRQQKSDIEHLLQKTKTTTQRRR